MQSLSEVAQAHRRAVMTPDADQLAFESAQFLASAVRLLRAKKRAWTTGDEFTPGWYESHARKVENAVREIALQSEILLARRASVVRHHRAMLEVMLGSSL